LVQEDLLMGFAFRLDPDRLFALINSFPHEHKVALGYRVRTPAGWEDVKPSPEEQQRIVNAIADQAAIDREFQQAVYNRLANPKPEEPSDLGRM
jgi:hypothetical protein